MVKRERHFNPIHAFLSFRKGCSSVIDQYIQAIELSEYNSWSIIAPLARTLTRSATIDKSVARCFSQSQMASGFVGTEHWTSLSLLGAPRVRMPHNTGPVFRRKTRDACRFRAVFDAFDDLDR